MSRPVGRLLIVLIALAIAGAMWAAACSPSEEEAAPPSTRSPSATSTAGPTTTTVPLRPTSTTSTSYAPGTLEGEVEAAYLRSWDVYAEQVWSLELDEAALAEVFTGDELVRTIEELRVRAEGGRASWVRAERSIDVVPVPGKEIATIFDTYVNHQVLIDPVTKEPVEADPDETFMDIVTLEKVDGAWRVSSGERVG
ncbi:MAG: hypothetical protein AB7L84_15790 [Acidimicrobiia bacterium]